MTKELDQAERLNDHQCRVMKVRILKVARNVKPQKMIEQSMID